MKLPPFKIERYYARHEFSARYLLSSSDCESMTIEELLAYEPGAAEALRKQRLGYTESLGAPELRTAIAAQYAAIAPDQVLVHTGAEEAIFTFANATLEPGDHVIVHAPCYQSLAEVARGAGCEVSLWMTGPENGWALDLNALERVLRPTTRAIIVNCPHNPTGYLMDRDLQARLIDLARANHLLLFSDEVYRGLEYDPADRLPAACDLYENAISLGVLSKTHGLPGLRIGWIATRNRAVYDRMAAFKDYLSICNSAPGEFLATIAMRHSDALAARSLATVRANLVLLEAFFKRQSALFDWQAPRAGAIAFPALRLEQPVESFCEELVQKQGVLLLPGTCYDYPGQHFRIGFGRKNMPESLAAFESALQEYA